MKKDVESYHLKQKIHKLEETISYLERENKFKDKQIDELIKESYNLKDEINRKDSEISDSKVQIDIVTDFSQKQNEQKDTGIYHLEEEIRDLDGNVIFNLEQEIELKDNEIDELKQELSNLKDIIDEKDSEISDLEDKIDRARDFIQEREDQIESIIQEYS